MDRRKFLSVAGGGVGAVAAGGLLLTSGCGKKENVLKIASSLPRTGSAQGQTDTIVNGIKMAIDDYNGEIAGMKIHHQDMDDATAAQGQWDAGKEADNAREAANDKDVMVFIGPYNSGAAKVSMPLLNEAGLLQISPAATWPGLTKKVPGLDNGEPDIYRKSGKITFCRVCPTDDTQGPLTAEFVAKVLKAKTVYILDDKELYGAGIAGLFHKKCDELGIKVLGHENIVPKQSNYQATIRGIMPLKPDVLYLGATSQSGAPQIAIDMKGLGLNCPLVVPDGCYEKAFIDGAGADTFKTLTCYATIGSKDPSQLTSGPGGDFVKKYKEKYKNDPEAYALYGYEAAKVFLEAVKKVGTKDRAALLKTVLETKDFDKGVLGKWSFNNDGDTTLQDLTISKIVDGKFSPVPRS
ncbi:MAG: branched-chain amino acid ABC transporter substrate-binding protein [Planctomycetes bacterium]|nr:branched-chain amino acid ABC transporter substrate-binding protein [Planctomycetota bacterium]